MEDDIPGRLGAVEKAVSELRIQVSTIVATIPHLATKADVAELRSEVKTEVSELRTEMKAGIAGLRTEMADLRTELKTDIAGLKTEMADLRTEMKTDIARLKTELASANIAAFETRLVKTFFGSLLAVAILSLLVVKAFP